MELLQLKYFCRVAKIGSISAVAKEFSVPASSVSQSIKRLEKELNIKLFNRKANAVSLSEKGAVFLEYVEKSLNSLENGIAATTDDINSGEISICINTNRRIVMETVEKFKKVFPDVSVKTRFICNDNFDDFNIVIDKEGLCLNGYTSEKLISEELAVAMSKNFSLSEKRDFKMSDLKDAPFIIMGEKTSLYESTLSVCEKFGFAPKIAIQSDDPFYIRKCVELGLGVAVVPLFSWLGQFNDSVILKPIKNCTRTTFVYINNKKFLSLKTKEFLKMLKVNCKESE
ncbi:MAG: LysR family transcriptional regulator [Clostridia bacterium]|nr:LysR family transcriptional regulator [Clostridia bacterium]